MTTAGLRGFKPTPETQQGMRIRAAFDKTCATIRANTELSDLGKQRAMAAAWLKTRASLAEIQATETRAVVARRAELELQIFGIGTGGPAAAADYRDAQDRAERCAQPADALRLLNRTTRTGDETLAKAIAGFSVEQGWTGVLDHYASTRPAVRDALAELQQIDHDAADAGSHIARGAIYTPTKPAELQRFSDLMITDLATTNDPSTTGE